MKKTKEIPIGGIGIIDGHRVIAKEFFSHNSCDECCFSLNAGNRFPCPSKKCVSKYRTDKKHVYFVTVEP